MECGIIIAARLFDFAPQSGAIVSTGPHTGRDVEESQPTLALCITPFAHAAQNFVRYFASALPSYRWPPRLSMKGSRFLHGTFTPHSQSVTGTRSAPGGDRCIAGVHAGGPGRSNC